MSASIGEPGHETSGWTHSICDNCWNKRHADRQVNHATSDHAPNDDPCCYCGAVWTCGIYVREDAKTVHVAPLGSDKST